MSDDALHEKLDKIMKALERLIAASAPDTTRYVYPEVTVCSVCNQMRCSCSAASQTF